MFTHARPAASRASSASKPRLSAVAAVRGGQNGRPAMTRHVQLGDCVPVELYVRAATLDDAA